MSLTEAVLRRSIETIKIAPQLRAVFRKRLGTFKILPYSKLEVHVFCFFVLESIP